MVAQPKLVLLDEPAAGVNPALLAQIVERIEKLNEQGLSFLLIEHNVELVQRLCHPVLVMAQGRLLAQGDAQTVLADPRVIEAYWVLRHEPASFASAVESASAGGRL